MKHVSKIKIWSSFSVDLVVSSILETTRCKINGVDYLIETFGSKDRFIMIDIEGSCIGKVEWGIFIYLGRFMRC